MGNCTTNSDIDESAKVQNTEQKDVETQEVEDSTKMELEDDAVKPEGQTEPPKVDKEEHIVQTKEAEPEQDAAPKEDTGATPEDIDQQFKDLGIEEVDETKTSETTQEQDSNPEPEPEVEVDEHDEEGQKADQEDAPPDAIISEKTPAVTPNPEPESVEHIDAANEDDHGPIVDEPKEDEATVVAEDDEVEDVSGPPKTEQQLREEVERELKPTVEEPEEDAQPEEPTKWEVVDPVDAAIQELVADSKLNEIAPAQEVVDPNESPVIVA